MQCIDNQFLKSKINFVRTQSTLAIEKCPLSTRTGVIKQANVRENKIVSFYVRKNWP